jgi:putative oxidoreductase
MRSGSGDMTMQKRLASLLFSSAPAATVLIRALLAAVFISEGIQKFLFPEALGVGRFSAIGIPAPEVMGPFVGSVEITCGLLVAIGFATRLAVVPLIIVMMVAIGTTKLPILLDRGFWAMAHETRTDLSMLLCSIFLGWVGSGPFSADAVLARRLAPRDG